MASGDNSGTELALRIFISSPGDVSEERVVAQRVVERIAARVAPRVTLAPILWEHEPLRASSTPQADVPDPSVCDMVVCILWSRLGTRLPSNVTRPDGSHYNSGTEFEFESAINAFSEIGRPHLLVYRKTAEATISLSDTQRVRQGLERRRTSTSSSGSGSATMMDPCLERSTISSQSMNSKTGSKRTSPSW